MLIHTPWGGVDKPVETVDSVRRSAALPGRAAIVGGASLVR